MILIRRVEVDVWLEGIVRISVEEVERVSVGRFLEGFVLKEYGEMR